MTMKNNFNFVGEHIQQDITLKPVTARSYQSTIFYLDFPLVGINSFQVLVKKSGFDYIVK